MTTARATSWSITINNPTKADEECIQLARQKSGWSVIGQLEKGDNGTPHYQLMLKTPQVRFSAIKKAFPRAHIEVARNADALETYVQKDETRIGQIESNEMYPSLTKFWDLFYDYKYDWDNMNVYQFGGKEEWLAHFDEFVNDAIERGYHVETMAVNPQIRSIVAKFMPAIFKRTENIRRQLDIQTREDVEVEKIVLKLDEIISCGYNINATHEEIQQAPSLSQSESDAPKS